MGVGNVGDFQKTFFGKGKGSAISMSDVSWLRKIYLVKSEKNTPCVVVFVLGHASKGCNKTCRTPPPLEPTI